MSKFDIAKDAIKEGDLALLENLIKMEPEIIFTVKKKEWWASYDDCLFYHALKHKQFDIAQVLLTNMLSTSAGINIVIREKCLKLALNVAIELHKNFAVTILNQTAVVDYTHLLTATMHGNIELITRIQERLTAQNIVINATEMLEAAISGTKLAHVKYWLDQTAKIPDDIVFSAAITGSTEIVQFMIEKGFNINFIYENGRSPLMEVVVLGHHLVAELLLKAGCEKNVRTPEGESIWDLYNIRMTPAPGLMRVLLDGGCNPNIKLLNGKTIFEETLKAASEYGYFSTGLMYFLYYNSNFLNLSYSDELLDDDDGLLDSNDNQKNSDEQKLISILTKVLREIENDLFHPLELLVFHQCKQYLLKLKSQNFNNTLKNFYETYSWVGNNEDFADSFKDYILSYADRITLKRADEFNAIDYVQMILDLPFLPDREEITKFLFIKFDSQVMREVCYDPNYTPGILKPYHHFTQRVKDEIETFSHKLLSKANKDANEEKILQNNAKLFLTLSHNSSDSEMLAKIAEEFHHERIELDDATKQLENEIIVETYGKCPYGTLGESNCNISDDYRATF